MVLTLIVVVGASDVVGSFLAAPAFDESDRCAEGETGRCLARARGIVADGGRFYDIKARYDDGRRAVGLFILGEEPEAGTRVWLESWDGEFVSVVDRSTETRYRTADWPERWDIGGIIGTLLLAGVAAALVPWRRMASRPRA